MTLAFLGLLLSAYFSGSEIAFITANPLQIQIWSSQNILGAKRSLKYIENREKVLSTILVGNTLSNMLATSYATVVIIRYHLLPYWLISIFVSFIILILGELIPKTLVRERANHASRFFAVTITFIEIVLLPLTLIARAFTALILLALGSKQEDFNAAITREDFDQSIDHSHRSGVIDEEKRDYIRNVIEFSDTDAGEIETPRTDIVALPETASISEVKDTLIRSGFSKLLIYRDTIDEIIGFIVLHDLFKNPESIQEILREVELYPDTKSTFELLKEFQEKNISIAVIVDEFGGTSGIVTMEDLVEEIFGDFEDEYDEDSDQVKVLVNGDLLLDGRTDIDDLNDEYDLNLPEGEYETIAGYILDVLDRIPERGESFTIGKYNFRVIKATPKSIDTLRIHRRS